MEIRRRPPNPKVKVANLEYAIPHSEEKPRNLLEKIVWQSLHFSCVTSDIF